MNNTKVTYIPNELASAVKGGFVTSSKEIKDRNLNTSQEEVNKRVVQAGDDIYRLQQTAFSGSYLDLTDKPNIPTIPQNVSYFENDLDYATKEYVRNELQGALSEYPETLETVRNLQEILNDDSTTREIFEAISTKANSSDVYTKTEADLRFLRDHQDISGKANVEDVYSKDKTYSKSEVNLKIGDIGELSVKQYILQWIASLQDVSTEITNSLEQKIDANNVYTKDQADLKFQLQGNYATEEFVNNQISNIQFPDQNLVVEYIIQTQQQIALLQQKQVQLQEYITQLQSTQQKHIILSQERYDSLESYEKDVIYIIVDQEQSNWTFGDTFPIILS